MRDTINNNNSNNKCGLEMIEDDKNPIMNYECETKTAFIYFNCNNSNGKDEVFKKVLIQTLESMNFLTVEERHLMEANLCDILAELYRKNINKIMHKGENDDSARSTEVM